MPEEYPSWSWYIPYGPALWKSLENYPQSVARRFNTITRIFEFDCRTQDDMWIVLVETALPAAGELALAILGFDWDDIARGFLRPYGLRSRSKTRRGKKSLFRLPEIPEIGELIGENLPGAEVVKASRINNALRWVWMIDGLLQRALWYWLLFDVTVDFFYNWSTGIMTSARCAHGEHGGMHTKATKMGSVGPVVLGTVPCSACWNGRYSSWGDDPCDGTSLYSPYGTLQAVFTAQLECVIGDKNAELQLGFVDETNRIRDLSWRSPVARETSDAAISVVRIPEPVRIKPVYSITGNGGVYFLNNITIAASH